MQKLCTSCHYIGLEDSTTDGRAKTESALWTAAFVLAFAGVFESSIWLPATIFFTAAVLYTLSRRRLKICVCSKCGSDSMIPLSSPKAAQIIAENHIPVPLDLPQRSASFFGFTLRDALFALTTILVAAMLYKEFY